MADSSPTSKFDFDSILLEVVENTLAMVFGRPTLDIIFRSLEKRGIRRDEIPGSFDQFNTGLAGLLGQGYPALEKLMAKRLCLRLQREENPDADIKLVDLVSELRRRFK